MEDVLGANSVHSQILYTEFILMLFSSLSMLVSITNYEINYDQLITFKDFTFSTYKEMINVFALLFNSFTTMALLINIYFRNKLQVSLEAYTNNLTHQDTLTTSGYIWRVIFESFVALIHPNIFLLGKNYIYSKIYTEQATDYLTISLNEYLLAIMMCRVYFILKFFLTLSDFKTSRASRTCRLYGESNTYLFAVRCNFNTNPLQIIVIIFLTGMTFFAIVIRIFERAFTNPVRNSSYLLEYDTFAGFNSMFNSVWCSVITMLTVGYGDYITKSWMGRFFAFFEVLTGLLVVSLVTVAFYQHLELNPTENKIFMILSRIQLRQRHEELQKQMVDSLMYHHYYIFKYKKIKENLELNDAELPSAEKLKLEIEMKKFSDLKIQCKMNMKHVVRDKNQTLKKLENISTSSYIMESIIDSIVGITDSIEESNLKVEEIIKKIFVNAKKDEVYIQSIKRKMTTDKQIKNRKKKLHR